MKASAAKTGTEFQPRTYKLGLPQGFLCSSQGEHTADRPYDPQLRFLQVTVALADQQGRVREEALKKD